MILSATGAATSLDPGAPASAARLMGTQATGSDTPPSLMIGIKDLSVTSSPSKVAIGTFAPYSY